MDVRLVITDIDGVWTDGGMYYDQTGNEWKKFNTYDSAGVLMLKSVGIPCAIMTGEDTEMVRRRAEKLGITLAYHGVKNKWAKTQDLCQSLGIGMKSVAYVGDDFNDMPVLAKAGLSACPSSAPKYVQKMVDWVLEKRGGEGAFREFVERILDQQGRLDAVVGDIVARQATQANPDFRQ